MPGYQPSATGGQPRGPFGAAGAINRSPWVDLSIHP
jgi:hypothetical protein